MYRYLWHISQIFQRIRSLFSYRFLAEGKTTSSNRSLKRPQKREREGRPVARPTRCALHDYLPNFEYNFLISYKIQSTSTLPSRTSSQSTLRRFPSLSGFCTRNKRNEDDEETQENTMKEKEEGGRKRERERNEGCFGKAEGRRGSKRGIKLTESTALSHLFRGPRIMRFPRPSLMLCRGCSQPPTPNPQPLKARPP